MPGHRPAIMTVIILYFKHNLFTLSAMEFAEFIKNPMVDGVTLRKPFCKAVKGTLSLVDPGGRTRRPPPPNGRGPKIFYAQNAIFSQFFLRSLRSRLMLSINLIKVWQTHAKNEFYFNLQHFKSWTVHHRAPSHLVVQEDQQGRALGKVQ